MKACRSAAIGWGWFQVKPRTPNRGPFASSGTAATARCSGATPEPLERRRVAADVFGRILDEHGLAGARDVRRRERHVEGQPGHRLDAVLRVAPRRDRPQLRLAGLDEEHHGAVRAQRGDPARHEQVGDLGGGQGARELRRERLERLEAPGGQATVALAERRPSERVRGDGRDGRERRSEAGGQPPRDGLPQAASSRDGTARRSGLRPRPGPESPSLSRRRAAQDPA